jgi:hypothetical protein
MPAFFSVLLCGCSGFTLILIGNRQDGLIRQRRKKKKESNGIWRKLLRIFIIVLFTYTLGVLRAKKMR